MSSQSRRLAIVLLVAILSTLVLPLLVMAGTVDDASPPSAKPAPGPSGLYQVRCWQYGRLLFEERDVLLPTDIAAGLKLRGSDRNRNQFYVADTGNATCLIRGLPAKH